MNFSQISAFRAVMTSATLSDAATKLGRTQPAVSAAIKTLEDQLGVKLFEREGRKLVPVPEAHYLLTEAETILDQMARVRVTMKSLVDGQSGNLNVAAMPGPVSMLFPKFVAQQIGGTKAIKVSIFARSSSQIGEMARAQSIDFGFADAPDSDGNDELYKAQYISANCFVALPDGHELAKKETLDLKDLDSVPLGTLQATHPHTQDLAARFASRSLSFTPTIESQTFLPILQFVTTGQCCAVLDPLTVVHVEQSGFGTQGISIRAISEPIPYVYAVLSPQFRPISVLAERLRAAWHDEVIALLQEVGAAPRQSSHHPTA